MKLSQELIWRGFVAQHNFKDLSEIDSLTPCVFYHGYDVSSDSQTIGNLAAMMLDKILIRHGYKALILIGGATTLIGDPGGKTNERELQLSSTINSNASAATKEFKSIFRDDNIKLINNLDWTQGLTLVDFLRDVGKHINIATLIDREYIKTRLGHAGSGISFAEFSYTLLQGFDYLYLFDKYGVRLQLGGSDQWGNCLTGVELIRKKRNVESYVLTMHLVINKLTGQKFGKSETGAVWLSEKKTSVFDFYQFWLNVDDENVLDYLKIYTDLNKEEYLDLIESFNLNKASRIAQKFLAFSVTSLVHGEHKADLARDLSEILFENKLLELSKKHIDLLTLASLTHNATGDLAEDLIDSGLVSSRSQLKAFLKSGAVSINGVKVFDLDSINYSVNTLVKIGKNKFRLFVF